MILLKMVDDHWKDHLLGMDHLREGIGLRGYGQKNPLDEYKKEGFSMFEEMIGIVKTQTISTLMRVQVASPEEIDEMERVQQLKREEMAKSVTDGPAVGEGLTPVSKGKKVGRNAPCPCGSGKKYKRCCGKKR